jgi:hypothetical protein
MKNSIYLSMLCIAVALSSLSSCEDGPPAPPPDDPVLELDTATLDYTLIGGENIVIVTSNQKWTIELEQAGWLWPSTLTGEGNATVTFTATPYEVSQPPRTNVITIQCETISRRIDVIQNSEEPTLTVSPESLSWDYSGGTKFVTIDSNIDWEVVIDTSIYWLTAHAVTSDGHGEIILTVPENEELRERRATIVVKREEAEQPRREIEVSQGAPPSAAGATPRAGRDSRRWR